MIIIIKSANRDERSNFHSLPSFITGSLRILISLFQKIDE